MTRVAVAGLAREVNSFAGGVGTIEDFQHNTLLSGDEILDVARQNDSIAGVVQVAAERGIDLVPTFYARSTSGPPVTAEDYRLLRSRVLDSLAAVIDDVDGVYLRLHGAMVADGCDDVEGDLLQAVRALAGEKPIAASFDFHAHMTAAMAAATPLIAGYQTSPHVDMINTGRRAMTLLADALNGTTRPVIGFRKIPVLSASEAQFTTVGPVAEVMAQLHDVEKRSDVLDASIFATQPWLDVAEYGWTVVVVGNGDHATAQTCADTLAAALFDRRERLVVTKTPIAEALAAARATPAGRGPVVVADGADSPSAGSTGDSAELLEAVLAEPVGGLTMCSIADAPAVQDCFAAGVGERVSTSVGGRLSPHFFSPLSVTGTVVTLCDGLAHNPARPMDAGRTAVLRIGEVFLVVTERAVSMLDRRLYDRVGLDVSAARLVQAKSAGGYRENYHSIAVEMIDLDVRGPAQHDMLTLPFTRIPRPLWPFDRDVERGW